MEAKQCPVCGTVFLPKYKVSRDYWARRKFCSNSCKNRGRQPPTRTGIRKPLEERLWSRVAQGGEDDCWLWQGIKDGSGYGMMYKTKGTWYKVHRLAYELSIGPIPPGLHVLHRCDVPCCVNPKHLWVGTHRDNMLDKEKKGRGGDRHGEKNGRAKLTDEQVDAMRTLYATGNYSQAALGVIFECSEAQAQRIVTYRQRRVEEG